MLANGYRVVCFFLLILVVYAKYVDIEEMPKTLNEMLSGIRSERRLRNHDDVSPIWQGYEFNTGAGNREEVFVTNISAHRYAELPDNANWQFLQAARAYFMRAENSTLFFCSNNSSDYRSIECGLNITTEGRILLFRVLDLRVDDAKQEDRADDLIAVMLVKSEINYSLYWYRISGNNTILYTRLPIQYQFENMEFVEEAGQHELLLLYTDVVYLEKQSLIDVYGFRIDDTNRLVNIWLCRRLYVPKTYNFQICSIYESTMLVLHEADRITLYKSRSESMQCQFDEFNTISSSELANLVCFMSGYIEYMAIAGKQPRLFQFVEDEFQVNTETHLRFNDAVAWVAAVPLNTYRDESLLLLQLENLTVIALAWQGSIFKEVSLPNRMDNFDLSNIVVVPNVGFLQGNTLVRIEVVLKEVEHPIHHETESLLKTRILLEEVFRKQETVFAETEARLNRSYLTNPAITGFWNISRLDVTNGTLGEDVTYNTVKVGSINLTREDILTDVQANLRKLQKLEEKLDQILSNLTDIVSSNSMKITLSSDIKIVGDFVVNGTMQAKKVIAASINDAPIDAVNNTSRVEIVSGRNSFPSINADNLTILSLNGIPLDEIVFDSGLKNYSDLDFTKLARLEIDGNLNFSEINGIQWEQLMRNVVWKDRPAIIRGNIIVDGQIIAKKCSIQNLNGMQYPEDYILDNEFSVYVTGVKNFSKLSALKLQKVNTINGINIKNFILLNRNEVIDKEITFEHLEIDESLDISGNISGIKLKTEPSLNEVNTLKSDVIFDNLIVSGNIVLADSINGKTWSDLDDFLLRGEEDAVITGNKKFLSGVTLKSTVQVGRINGHAISEFVTLDTDQKFSNLKRISSNVTFGNVSLGAVKKLEDYIVREQNSSSNCQNKVIHFIVPPIVDELSFESLKQKIPATTFFSKLNETLRKVYFENLTLTRLIADEVTPNVINGIRNYADLAEHVLTASARQNLSGSLTVNDLETDVLDAEFINGIPTNELSQLLDHAKSLYDQILVGNASVLSLKVTGTLIASSVNNRDIVDIYDHRNMATVIFEDDVTIKNLKVVGLINGINLTELVADAVWKTDRNVTFTSRKILNNITCEFLDVRHVNGHSVYDILDFTRQQTLKGPVFVNGSVTVLRKFNTAGKVGNISFRDITERIQPLGNNSYALRGDIHFTEEDVFVAKLDASGTIQGSSFDDFLRMAIPRSDTNVVISGMKLFTGVIVFKGPFIIDGTLNDLDLHTFREKAVRIDKPFSVETKVVFKENIHVKKNLLVKTKLNSNTVAGVDLNELQENAIIVNKPTYFQARVTLTNATFQESIEVAWVNDLNTNNLIPLRTDQFITTKNLKCHNVTVKNIQLSGLVNNVYLDEIYTNTFMIYGNQNITGNIKIRENVYAYHDFNTHYINGFHTKRIAFLTITDTLIGDFTFAEPVVLDKSLRILGLMNKIKPINWHGTAVRTANSLKQIIYGKWRVHGNVRFEGDIIGDVLLNGRNFTEMSAALKKGHTELQHIVTEANETLNGACEILHTLSCHATSRIYKFDTFEYMKILEFEGIVHDIRNFEHADDFGYLLVNYNLCRMKLLLYSPNGIEELDEVDDVGLVDRWIFYKMNHTTHLLTVAKHACGRSLNNIWKLENNSLIHVLEIGNNSNFMNIYQSIAMTRDDSETISENVQSDSLTTRVSNEEENLKAINDSVVLADRIFPRELQGKSSNATFPDNCLDCKRGYKFRVGIFEREQYIHYNEGYSRDYIYLCKNDVSQTRILQIIKARRPKSFLVLNFGLIETLLVFVENDEVIRIYEYRGVEGFVYRNSIEIKIDKLYSFKMRRYPNAEKRHCLAAIDGNRLTIFEAKMHGEKLDPRIFASASSCSINMCSMH